MNKAFLIFLFAVLSTLSFAQSYNTEYYKLTKIYNADGTSTAQPGTSGQFVTRTKQICYDSKKDGVSVGNGTLKLINQVGDDSKYFGDCYYGSDCSYTFYDAKGLLNIKTPGGKVYVYKKSTPPAGRTTCSLIRSNSGSGGGYDGGGYVAPPSNNGGTSTQRNGSTKTKHTCTVCGGKGKKIKEYYGAGMFKYCPECGRQVSEGHQHVMCDYCKGTGYIMY